MKVEGKRISLTREEIARSVCPQNPVWAKKMLELYGFEGLKHGSLLERISKCPSFLRQIGYEVVEEG